MTTYIVKLEIHPDSYDQYLDWLYSEHIPELLEQKGFIEAEVLTEKQQESLNWIPVDVYYRLGTKDDLDDYLTNHAPRIRQKGLDRWQNQFKAVREIWHGNKKILQSHLHETQKVGYNKSSDNNTSKEARMAYHLDVKKLLKDIRGPKGISAITDEVAKASNELQKLKADLQPQAEAKVKEAKTKLLEVQKRLKSAQKDLDKELSKTLVLVKKYSKEAEKGFHKVKAAVTKKKAPKRSAKKATTHKAKRK